MGQRDIKAMNDDELVGSWTDWLVRTHNAIAHVYNSRDVFSHVRLMADSTELWTGHSLIDGHWIDVGARLSDEQSPILLPGK